MWCQHTGQWYIQLINARNRNCSWGNYASDSGTTETPQPPPIILGKKIELGNYADDVRTGYLFFQLEILKVLIKEAQINCFADVLKAVKSLTDHERHMITEVIVICKLLLVNPATSASGERSFSMARRVKTWLRANMKQQCFLLHTHEARTDKIRLLDVAN